MKARHGSGAARPTRSAKRPSATPATFSIRSATNIRCNYYVSLAKELEKMGAHILAIKDMAGLCRPYAADKLVKALREEVGLPIHFHTHDTSGINAASDLESRRSGRATSRMRAIASMSGTTSQPNLNSIVAALRTRERDTGLDLDALNRVLRLLGDGARLLRAVRHRARSRHGGSLYSRNARRPIHQSEGTGRTHGPGRALAGDRAHLRRREPALSATSSK